MLNYFRSKRIQFELGKEKGRAIASSEYSRKFIKFKNEANKIIAQKNSKIRSLEHKVSEIEESILQFSSLFSRAKYMALSIQEENNIKFQEMTENYQQAIKFSDEVLSLDRMIKKSMPKIEKKIDKFKEKNLS